MCARIESGKCFALHECIRAKSKPCASTRLRQQIFPCQIHICKRLFLCRGEGVRSRVTSRISASGNRTIFVYHFKWIGILVTLFSSKPLFKIKPYIPPELVYFCGCLQNNSDTSHPCTYSFPHPYVSCNYDIFFPNKKSFKWKKEKK